MQRVVKIDADAGVDVNACVGVDDDAAPDAKMGHLIAVVLVLSSHFLVELFALVPVHLMTLLLKLTLKGLNWAERFRAVMNWVELIHFCQETYYLTHDATDPFDQLQKE